MVAAKKASTPAKKAAAKAPASSEDTAEKEAKASATAAAKAEAEKRRQERVARDTELTAQVVEMRKDETSWSEIAEQLGISQGKAMFLEMVSQVTPKTRITGDTDEELGPKIVEARNAEELNSWGWIAARSGLGESKVRSLFKEYGGGEWLGHRIGKGGRFPGDVNPDPDAESTTKATKTSGKTAKSAVDRNPDKVPVAEMNLAQLKTRFNDGVGFTHKNSEGKAVKATPVKTVKSLKNGTMSYTGTDTKDHAVKIDSITKVDR